MNLYRELKTWLTDNQIEYSELDYIKPYETRDPQNLIQRQLRFLAPKTTENRECKKLIISSNNGKKDLEIWFEKEGSDYRFEDIVFGEYDFEMFDYDEDYVKESVIDLILSVMKGDLKVISVSRQDTGAWIGDACFDMSDSEDRIEYSRYMERVENKKTHPYIRKGPMKHEIYDWNTYECIIRD